MKEGLSRRGILTVLVLSALAVAPALAKCYKNATYYNPETGSTQTCEWVCVVTNGIMTSGCN